MQLTDYYPDLDALKRDLKLGTDYRIVSVDRASEVTLVAIHGGFIDEGSSAIAGAIAGNEYNLFDFQGLRRQNSFDLHVTSHRFRDPALDQLLSRSRLAVSIHGMADPPGAIEVWLGGLNLQLKVLMLAALRTAQIAVNPDAREFRGVHPLNVVNLPPEHGVQLELPYSMRRAMFNAKRLYTPHRKALCTTKFFADFVQAVRFALTAHGGTGAIVPPK